MEKHFAIKIAATNKSEDKENTIIREEDFGSGYPIDEATYNKKENKKDMN